MAETKNPTFGQILSRVGGLGTRGDPNHAAIASAVQSNTLSRSDVRTLTSMQLAMLGTGQYKALYPETYAAGTRKPQLMSADQIALAAWQELRASLTGLGNYYYKKLIDTKIRSVQKRMGKAVGEVEFDIPDWLKPFISEGQPYQAGGKSVLPQRDRGGRGGYGREQELPEGAGQLRPLGAQTELSLSQQRFMQGYVGWGKEGFATRLRRNIQDMTSAHQANWAEQVRQSQSLFPPNVRLGVQKRVAEQ